MKRSGDPFYIPSQAKDKKKGTITEVGQTREVSETFLVGQAQSLWLGRVIGFGKLRFFLIVLLLFFLILFSRLFFLQFVYGPEFRGLAEGNRLRLEFILPSRGIIFDRFGIPLVENVATFSLFFNPPDFNHKADEKEKLLNIFKELEIPPNTIDSLFESESYLPLAVKENLSYEKAIELMLKIQDTSSLKIIIDPQRKYAEKSALAHLLGYTSRINKEEKDGFLKLGYQLTEKVGRGGIEEYYQKYLRGRPGKKQIEVDAYGRENKVIATMPPLNGQNLILSLDASLQEKIYQTLERRLPSLAGAVVALDPRSGKVRALVSWPTFDSNAFGSGISPEEYQAVAANPLKPFFNRVIAGEYPSGSTIKLIIGLAGLEEGLITRATQVYSVGGVWYDKWFFPDWKEGGHGYTNIVKAIAESVNTYFYYLALEEFEGQQGLGLEKMIAYFREFGLGKVLGIDENGERPGFLPTKEWKIETKGEVWYPGDTLHLAIGQGDILVTPLQVASFTGVIANGGTLFRPQLVEKVINPQTNEASIIEPEIIARHLADENNIAIILEGMQAAVTSGSARGLAGVGARVAGKTGTAQVGADKKPHAWFTGFLPADNPNLVLTVLVENGGEGSEMAVPIARDILNWYAENR